MPCVLTTGTAPCCTPPQQQNDNLQDKDALPKGRLSQAYKQGVLFVTYSLLAMGNQVPGVKTGPLAKALQVVFLRGALGGCTRCSRKGRVCFGQMGYVREVRSARMSQPAALLLHRDPPFVAAWLPVRCGAALLHCTHEPWPAPATPVCPTGDSQPQAADACQQSGWQGRWPRSWARQGPRQQQLGHQPGR